ncbi:MAG: DinB family protein [Actinomycetota bacterium]|nr:DinB family protein [Actinomycetota bacterium]
MHRCPECGFIYDLGKASVAGQMIWEGIADVVAILRRNTVVDLRTRRQPSTWSPLEYGCHLRDVLLVQRERVLAARRTDRPDCPPMGRDERVDHDGYAEQESEDVARQLTDAAQMFSNVLDRLDTNDWTRSLIYNYPHPRERSLQWVVVHTAHEVHHHLLDIRRQLT